MSARETAWQTAAQASEALGPETGLLGRLDPADFGASLLTALTRAGSQPAEALPGLAAVRFCDGRGMAGGGRPLGRGGCAAAGAGR